MSLGFSCSLNLSLKTQQNVLWTKRKPVPLLWSPRGPLTALYYQNLSVASAFQGESQLSQETEER